MKNAKIIGKGKQQIWVAYNHVPGGQIVVAHFEPYVLQRRMGEDRIEEVMRTAEEQMQGLIKQPNVALNVGGVVTKNKVLVYDGGRDLLGDARAAQTVIEWAIQKGLRPIADAMTQEPPIKTERLQSLEVRVDGMEKNIAEILTLLKGKS